MKKQETSSTFVAAIMEAVGLGPRRKLHRSGVRYLGINGSLGKGEVRHCSTWDFDYKLPRPAARSLLNDFNHR